MRTYFIERSCDCTTFKCCCVEDRIMDAGGFQRLNSLVSACMEDLEIKGTQ
jgi:hypothetical protein